MMRATGAKLRMLASEAAVELAGLGAVWDGSSGEELEGEADMAQAAGRPFYRYAGKVIRHRDEVGARLSHVQTAAIRRRADVHAFGAGKSDGKGRRGEVDAPLAIGSHRSCSLTSNSYPSPCACVS